MLQCEKRLIFLRLFYWFSILLHKSLILFLTVTLEKETEFIFFVAFSIKEYKSSKGYKKFLLALY